MSEPRVLHRWTGIDFFGHSHEQRLVEFTIPNGDKYKRVETKDAHGYRPVDEEDYSGEKDELANLARRVETLRAALVDATIPPHERSPESREELLPRLEKLSTALCQTNAYILDALERSGLTIVPLEDR